MRLLTDHKVCGNELNDGIAITVLDEPGVGGANHTYKVDVVGGAPTSGGPIIEIRFQKGPVKEAGFNGISNEALLAVLIDRMRGFQSGQFKNRENALALTAMEEALMWLQKRTRDRMAAGIEGTHKVGPVANWPIGHGQPVGSNLVTERVQQGFESVPSRTKVMSDDIKREIAEFLLGTNHTITEALHHLSLDVLDLNTVAAEIKDFCVYSVVGREWVLPDDIGQA